VRHRLVFFSLSIALLPVVSNAAIAQAPSQVSTASTVLSKQELHRQARQDCTKQAIRYNIADQNLADFDWQCLVPGLAPMAHLQFCLQFREDCEVRGIDFRRRNIAMTMKRWNELDTINREVNRDIYPQERKDGLPTQVWQVSPPIGDCNDYAVTKRHKLLALGWPSRALLLAEVLTMSGEPHLVLVVRMKDINLVLDNLDTEIWPIESLHYRWVRIESPQNPRFWLMVSEPSQVRSDIAPD
jgi:predicted transglutaminase-like cysteine proteinase